MPPVAVALYRVGIKGKGQIMDTWGSLLREMLGALKGETAQLGVAGVAGAIAASLTEWNGFIELIRKIIVGALCAVYLSDLAVPLLKFLLPTIGIDQDASIRLGGFIMGITGIIFIEFIIKVMRLRRDALKAHKDNKKGVDDE